MLTGSGFPAVVNLNGLPYGLGYVVNRCTQEQPDDRYDSIELLSRDFNMFTAPSGLLEEPAKAAMNIIAAMSLGTVSPDQLAALDQIFQANVGDETLLLTTFPQLPEHVVALYISQRPTQFGRLLKAYDTMVSGSLGFSYCDTVANFYRLIYSNWADMETRKLLLTRLIQMGVSHNRFHVMTVIGRILSGITDPAEAAIARDVLSDNDGYLQFLRPYLDGVRLPLLRQVIFKSDEA